MASFMYKHACMLPPCLFRAHSFLFLNNTTLYGCIKVIIKISVITNCLSIPLLKGILLVVANFANYE